jgi:ADP-heptose:LPS heptosyltransferase
LVEEPGAEVLEDNPNLRRVLVYGSGVREAWSWLWRLHREHYDWVIDFMGNPRSAMLTAASLAPMRAGPARAAHRWAYNRLWPQPPRACYGALEKMRALEILGVPAASDFLPKVYLGRRSAGAGELVALAPASRKQTRRWPAESYAALGRLLHERLGCPIVVLWGPGERALAESVAAGIGPAARVSDPTPNLASLARTLSDCRLLISNCSGTKHLAVALGVPTVTIHGSSDPLVWTPSNSKHVAVRLEGLDCIGCRRNNCPRGLECLTGLPPDRVLESALGLLERSPV